MIESINVHKEAEELTSLEHGRPAFRVTVHPRPSFPKFEQCMLNSRQRNVGMLHLAGHGLLKWGFLWLKDSDEATEYERIPIEKIVRIIITEAKGGGRGGTIECVMLNACFTEEMGRQLRAAGVLYVICWRSEVQDTTASAFALDFYGALDQQDPWQAKDYALAFDQAVARLQNSTSATRKPRKDLADRAIDFVCFLSHDGDKFPDTGRIRGNEEDEDPSRMANNTKGRAEMKGFKELGFALTYKGKDIQEGIELYEGSALERHRLHEYGLKESRYNHPKIAGKKLVMIHTQALRLVFGEASISGYQDLWCEHGVVEKRALQTSRTSRLNALKHFGESLGVRVRQANSSGGADASHQGMIDDMKHCIDRIKALDKTQQQHKGEQKAAPKQPAKPGAGNSFAALLGSSDSSEESDDDD